MNLRIETKDPLGVLASTLPVVENSSFVAIKPENIDCLAKEISRKFSGGIEAQDVAFSPEKNLKRDAQMSFVSNAVNFCFWPDKGKPKWEIEWPKGSIVGGWYGLINCFKRAMDEGFDILNAEYLRSLSLEDAKEIFRGKDEVEIPLLLERVDNLKEAGERLCKDFRGEFLNILEDSGYDACNLSRRITDNFPSFKDVSSLEGKEVVFLKRSQICANDLGYILKKNGKEILNLNHLTAFADYKLPQILRMFSVLEYEKSLAAKVDNFIEILHDSREEIEIRSATVWAVELLRQRIGNLSAGEIDNTIWLISQSCQDKAKPYHRTRTVFY